MPDTAFAELATLEPLSDDSFARLALEADPDTPVAADALSLWELAGDPANELLPRGTCPRPARCTPVGVGDASQRSSRSRPSSGSTQPGCAARTAGSADRSTFGGRGAMSKIALGGAIDLHCHFGPESVIGTPHSVDAFEAARDAAALGFSAIVLKSHDFPSNAVAHAVSTRVPDVRVYGSICCDFCIGGLNPGAVETALRRRHGRWCGCPPSRAARTSRTARGDAEHPRRRHRAARRARQAARRGRGDPGARAAGTTTIAATRPHVARRALRRGRELHRPPAGSWSPTR